MKKKFSRLSLCTKISMLFAILVVFIITITLATLYSYFHNTVGHFLTESVNSTIASNNYQLDSLLTRIESAERLVHVNEQLFYELGEEKPLPICKMIISYKGNTNQEFFNLREEYTTNLKNFYAYFNTCFSDYSGLYHNILFVDTTWPISNVMPKLKNYTQGDGFSSSREVMNCEWYKQAKKLNGDQYWFVDEADSNYICMAKALKYKLLSMDGTLTECNLGVLLFRFNNLMITQNINLTDLTNDADIFFIDDKDTIVYSVSQSNMNPKIAEKFVGKTEDVTKEVDLEGRKCLVNLNTSLLGLRVLTIVPIDNIQKSTSESNRIILITGITAIAIGIIAIRLLSISLLNPLKKLTKHMEKGNNNVISYESAGSREVTSLYYAYNHMIIELNDSMRKIIEATEKKNQAELYALQAQINPHFVYNTLNSVSCLAMLHGFEDIATVLGNLTMLMRYNVHLPDKLVPISDELYTIRQYENIQKCCYKESLRFEYEIDTEAEKKLIPKLIIQPLVENAIVHGADFQNNNAVIRLSVQMKEQNVSITVWDNGKNADVHKINHYLSDEKDMLNKGGSLGVKNVNQRLHKVFGDNASLIYEKDSAGNTMAIVTIHYGINNIE